MLLAHKELDVNAQTEQLLYIHFTEITGLYTCALEMT
jgi:hypothetical protein